MSDKTNMTPRCLVCEQTSDAVPLLTIQYQQQELWICPQHLPILIHDPAKLAGKLPGAEQLNKADGHDH